MTTDDPFGPDSEYSSPGVPRSGDSADGPRDGGARDDSQGDGGKRRRGRPWSLLVLAVLVLLLLEGTIVFVNHHSARRSASDPTRSAPVPTAASATAPVDPPRLAPQPVATTVRDVVPAGVTGPWELFARGPRVVLRLTPATGTLTQTLVPDLGSTGPVSFLAVPGEALIRPLDVVPGYVVPDGQPARVMDAALATSGPMLPGSEAGQVWVPSTEDAPSALVLRSVKGGGVLSLLPVPGGGSPVGAAADGRGGVLFTTPSGVFDGRAGSPREVSLGTVLAVGPTTWLLSECDVRAVCTLVRVDSGSGARRSLGAADSTWAQDGAVSPDGRTAALATLGVGGQPNLVLLDLTGPTATPRTVPVDISVGDGTLVWSPDSKWLFAVTGDGGLAIIDPRTGGARSLTVQLPEITQLAIRSAP